MTSTEYIGRVVEVARKHGATIHATNAGANVCCAGGSFVEVYTSTFRTQAGVAHEAIVAPSRLKWSDLECLLDIKRLVESMPAVVDGPTPTHAPVASPSGFGSGAIDDTKGT